MKVDVRSQGAARYDDRFPPEPTSLHSNSAAIREPYSHRQEARRQSHNVHGARAAEASLQSRQSDGRRSRYTAAPGQARPAPHSQQQQQRHSSRANVAPTRRDSRTLEQHVRTAVPPPYVAKISKWRDKVNLETYKEYLAKQQAAQTPHDSEKGRDGVRTTQRSRTREAQGREQAQEGVSNPNSSSAPATQPTKRTEPPSSPAAVHPQPSVTQTFHAVPAINVQYSPTNLTAPAQRHSLPTENTKKRSAAEESEAFQSNPTLDDDSDDETVSLPPLTSSSKPPSAPVSVKLPSEPARSYAKDGHSHHHSGPFPLQHSLQSLPRLSDSVRAPFRLGLQGYTSEEEIPGGKEYNRASSRSSLSDPKESRAPSVEAASPPASRHSRDIAAPKHASIGPSKLRIEVLSSSSSSSDSEGEEIIVPIKTRYHGRAKEFADRLPFEAVAPPAGRGKVG